MGSPEVLQVSRGRAFIVHSVRVCVEPIAIFHLNFPKALMKSAARTVRSESKAARRRRSNCGRSRRPRVKLLAYNSALAAQPPRTKYIVPTTTPLTVIFVCTIFWLVAPPASVDVAST
jgi:hypothetical protein